MTLILGIEEPDLGRAILACDSGAWKGDQVDRLHARKIWRSGDWILGLTGSWGHSQRMRRVDIAGGPDGISDAYLERTLLDWFDKAIENCIGAAELSRRLDPEQKSQTPALLAAHDSRIWYVADGEATRVERGWQAIGVTDYGLGAMAALRHTDQRDALEEAEITMRSVATITRSILGPFHWLATDGTEGSFE